MYEAVSFTQLKPGMYCIFVGKKHYYIGEFVSVGTVAQFKNIHATFPEGYVRMYQDQYFADNCVFKRFVSKEEQQKVYRDAYERKTLQKILSALLNEDFIWY